jgi:hypothetical protein
MILEARQKDWRIHGFHFDRFEKGQPDPSPTQSKVIGKWELQISRASVYGHASPGFGLIIARPDDKFVLVGEGYEVRFISARPAKLCSILSFDELDIVDGKELRRRFLNGDETMRPDGAVARMPWSDPDYAGFPIPITIPSRTMIAECVPYAIFE